MRYEISVKAEGEAFLPRRALEFCPEAGETELRVLLFACGAGSFEEEEMLAALGECAPESELREALAFWRGAGLFSKKRGARSAAAKPPQEKEAPKAASARPNYTSHDLASAVEKNADFKSLIDYAEHRLNKNFNGADLSLLYSFVDYLGLGVDVVMLAIEACAKEGKKSLRYIEKLLLDLCDRQIATYEEADAYFLRREEYLSFEGKIRAMCGFGTRALTQAEKKIITAWKDEYCYTAEELEAAYEKTVNAISKPAVSYMNKVLSTLREGAGTAQTPKEKTYDTEGRFAAAVARTKKKQHKEDGQ